MISNTDIADYYNQTLNHYQTWWKLDRVMALHYGISDAGTKSFAEELMNTNRILADMAGLKAGERVLDAGCGVGGSLFYMARQYNIQGVGCTLSEKQLKYAKKKAKQDHLEQAIQFKNQDFCHTGFTDESFDVIWALESLNHLADLHDFAAETFRLLKPGGRAVLAFYHATTEFDTKAYLQKWMDTWGMASILFTETYVNQLENAGLKITQIKDVTSAIFPTARRMYRASLLGALPSVLYNASHHTSRYARNHFKAGLYQYKALKRNLWRYKIIRVDKR